MAEALLGVVFEKLISLVQNEFATISGIKEEIDKLSSSLDLIKGVLEDAEEKQMTDRSIKVWLQQLKDAVYVLDDILDECSIQSHRVRGSSSFNPKNIVFRCGIGSRLKEIIRRFDQIAEGKNKFLLREGVREKSSEVAEWRQTSSIIDQPQLYGRDIDKEKIVQFLLGQACSSDFLSIYPIVGLGGAGKTTLAQLVYNDERVSNHFHIKIWVCVSENFSVMKILRSIIESITREKFDVSDLDVIGRKVQELLERKNYLLVLDDVWNRTHELEFGLSQQKWNKLKSVLSCGSKGASILVSTRDMDVATLMGTCQAHRLSGLSDDDCWLLFKQYAFGPEKEEHAALVAIGKEIVKKCGGLPLAAQALGGLLRSKSEEKEWLEVKESKIWTLPNENSILPALRLSYFHLTPTLKQCFAFCAIFPKDTRIMKEDLIHLWMANGFISSRENLDVEDVGNMVCDELYQKSFFQDIQTDYKGDSFFIMHDLVHDLAQSVTRQECVVSENGNISELSRSTHHVCLGTHLKFSFDKGAFKRVESLRTLYMIDFDRTLIQGYFPTTCSLRVLRIANMYGSGFKLSSLGNLIHLRYLELYKFTMKTLPDSIYSLQKLEILKLTDCRELRRLPKKLSCLQNLRHLVLSYCTSLTHICPNIGKLSSLRTLSVFIVRLETGHTLIELHDLKLGGKLRIEGLKNVGSLYEAHQANLKGKKDLHELCLSWEDNDETKSHANNPEQVLEAFQPHSNLKKLSIHKYEGLYFPNWIGMLSNLLDIGLFGCKKCVQLSALGKLPCLRTLEIWDVDNVQYMDDDESYDGVEVRAFPSLEKLTLRWLPNLEQLLKAEKRDMFLHLSDVFIQGCPKLRLPCLPSIKILYVYGFDNELLTSISCLSSLTYLLLSDNEDWTSFPEGVMRNLTCLETLSMYRFSKLKELPNELSNLKALEHLEINNCSELEYLPEGIRHLTSLLYLRIDYCPLLIERCREGTGEDWDKIAHIPKIDLYV